MLHKVNFQQQIQPPQLFEDHKLLKTITGCNAK